jgi:hypothetical protein
MDQQGSGQAATAKVKKRVVQRSPSYPAISLEDAITKVRLVFNYDRRNYTAPEVILKHLGYNEVRGGTGGRALSALRQYGLLDEKNDTYRVSDLAYRLLHLAPNDPERDAALKEAATKPAIFREIFANYPDGLPSDAALQNYLIKRNFNPDSVRTFVRAFRATMELAKPTPAPYTADEADREEGGESMTGDGGEPGRPDPRAATALPPMPFVVSHPRQVRAELRLTGRDLRREDIEKLKKQVVARLDELADAFEDRPTQPGESRSE